MTIPIVSEGVIKQILRYIAGQRVERGGVETGTLFGKHLICTKSLENVHIL